MEIKKIYLHWSATPYNWQQPGAYHTVIQGDGNVVRLTPYDHFLSRHTYQRNSNAVGIALACMGGANYWRDYPPTDKQIEAMCRETAELAMRLGWTKDDITVKKVMTHAEAASCRDGWHPHVNYGPVAWGGTGDRWDLMQLKQGETDNGGDVLREKIKQYMTEGNSAPKVLCDVSIDCNGTVITGLMYENRSTYVPVSGLASAYNFSIDWNPEKRRVYVYGETLPHPKYIHDDLGLTNVDKVDVCSTDGQVIMSGFLKDGRAHVRVVEFANEFDISLETANGSVKLGALNRFGGKISKALLNQGMKFALQPLEEGLGTVTDLSSYGNASSNIEPSFT